MIWSREGVAQQAGSGKRMRGGDGGRSELVTGAGPGFGLLWPSVLGGEGWRCPPNPQPAVAVVVPIRIKCRGRWRLVQVAPAHADRQIHVAVTELCCHGAALCWLAGSLKNLGHMFLELSAALRPPIHYPTDTTGPQQFGARREGRRWVRVHPDTPAVGEWISPSLLERVVTAPSYHGRSLSVRSVRSAD